MGLSQASALCFVIDTTGSMSDDIAEAKRVSLDIIDRKQGTEEEPSVYILVPFNDPGAATAADRDLRLYICERHIKWQLSKVLLFYKLCIIIQIYVIYFDRFWSLDKDNKG